MVNSGVFQFYLFGWKCCISSYFCTCSEYAHTMAFLWLCDLLHVCMNLHAHLSLYMCVCAHREKCAIYPRGGQKAPTCRRSAESITVVWKSKNREREKRWNIEQRGLTPPPDIVIASFSHHIAEERNNTQHTHSLGAHTEQHSQLFQQTEEREKSKNREGKRRRDGVKDTDSGGDKVPYPQSLYSPLLLYYFYTSLMQNML